MKASQMDTLFTSNPKRRVGFTVLPKPHIAAFYLIQPAKIDLGFIAQNTFLKTHLSILVLYQDWLCQSALNSSLLLR